MFGLYSYTFLNLATRKGMDQALAWSGYAIMIGLAALGLSLGIDSYSGRTFGGAQPNSLSHFALAAIFILAICGRLRWWGVGLCFAFLLFTQSRTVLITFFAFVLFFYFVAPVARRSGSILLIPAVAIATLLFTLVLNSFIYPLMNAFSIAIGVETKTRLGSNVDTGRDMFWNAGWSLFQRSPVLGYGFGTREQLDLKLGAAVNSHSGGLNLLLDVGLIGGALFFIWYLAAFTRALADIGRRPRVSSSCVAILVSMIPMLVAEPAYMSPYAPETVVLLMAMTIPFVRSRKAHVIPGTVASMSLGRFGKTAAFDRTREA